MSDADKPTLEEDNDWETVAEALDGGPAATEAPRRVPTWEGAPRPPTRVPLVRSDDAKLAMWWHRLQRGQVIAALGAVAAALVMLVIFSGMSFPEEMTKAQESANAGRVLLMLLCGAIGGICMVGACNVDGSFNRARNERLASENAVIADAIDEWMSRYREVESQAGDGPREERARLLAGIRYHYKLLPNDLRTDEMKTFVERVGMKGTPAEQIGERPVTHEESPLYRP